MGERRPAKDGVLSGWHYRLILCPNEAERSAEAEKMIGDGSSANVFNSEALMLHASCRRSIARLLMNRSRYIRTSAASDRRIAIRSRRSLQRAKTSPPPTVMMAATTATSPAANMASRRTMRRRSSSDNGCSWLARPSPGFRRAIFRPAARSEAGYTVVMRPRAVYATNSFQPYTREVERTMTVQTQISAGSAARCERPGS